MIFEVSRQCIDATDVGVFNISPDGKYAICMLSSKSQNPASPASAPLDILSGTRVTLILDKLGWVSLD